ncbi:hypothetical protein D9M72_628300 [compost metagenome]
MIASKGMSRRPTRILAAIIAPGVMAWSSTSRAPAASVMTWIEYRRLRVSDVIALLLLPPASSAPRAWICRVRQRLASAGSMPIASIASACLSEPAILETASTFA